MENYEYDTKMGESLSMDRFSELPNSLIHLILSFLPMRDVVSTTFLSKRWRNLWTSVPCFNFYEDINDGGKERVRNFVNRALILWNGTKILKFVIDIYNLVDLSLADDMDIWVRFSVKNKVEELKIHLNYDLKDEIMENAYWVPQCLNSCSSIRKLSLVGCNFRIHGSLTWNQLKSLYIDSFRLSEHSINQILLGSPRLEVFDLRLIESHDNLNIMSTSLKRLMIERYLYSDWDESSLDTVFRICCPNLKILEFDGGPYGECLFTDVSSLIDATLRFVDETFFYDDHLCLNKFGETMRQVFSTRVEKVALSDSAVRWCAQVLDASPKKYLHSPNVIILNLDLSHFNDFVEVMDLLGIFPNLKMLVIEFDAFMNPPEFMEFEKNLPKSFLLQLKEVEITARLSNFSFFGFIEFLLKHAIRLEKLVLRPTWLMSYRRKTLIHISEKLLSMPRSSPTAKVILKYD